MRENRKQTTKKNRLGGGYFNKKIIYNICLIVTILGLLFIVSGTSYALLSGSSSSDKEQIIRAGDVTISLSEYFENTNQKISVMSDTEGLLQEETYSFKLKNIGDVPARYDIKLVNEVPSSYTDSIIEDNYVKIGVEINGEEHGPFSLSEANNILDSGIIYENELISYDIRIWLNEDYEDEILEKEGSKGFYKIKVEAKQDVYDKNGAELKQTEALTEYRYSGSNEVVKNYVTFNDELWRIIGVFPTDDGTGKIENRLKIVREESVGDYSWDTSDSGVNSGYGINQWGESGAYEGADLMRLLNPGYEDESINNSLYYNRDSGTCYNDCYNVTTTCDFTNNGLTEKAQSMIDDAKWYVAATNYEVVASESYKEERGTTVGTTDVGITVAKTTSWIGKVGLMYPSDYGYASSDCRNGEYILWDYNNEICKNTNYLYNTNYQWLLSARTLHSPFVHYITINGELSRTGGDTASLSYGIRPVVYLSSSVKIISGDGTSSNPYILSK